jgi:hypothetical protein
LIQKANAGIFKTWMNILIEKNNPNWSDLAERWFVKSVPPM